jgi:hypothetical protein
VRLRAASVRSVPAGSSRTGTVAALGAAAQLCWSLRSRLLPVAAAIAVPIAGLVLVLDLIAWQPLDPAAESATRRRLGEAVLTVDGGRMNAIAVLRYTLGALAYALIIALSIRPLRGRGSGDRNRAPARAALAPLAAALAMVIVARTLLSLSAAALFGALAPSSAEAYLLALNITHALGKILTAPFLAGVVVVALWPESRPGRRSVAIAPGAPP